MDDLVGAFMDSGTGLVQEKIWLCQAIIMTQKDYNVLSNY
jgi:hypothetical protein